jgi:hypothetical protein
MTKQFIKEKRNLVETMLMTFTGSMIILSGFVICLLSIPLILIIIGFLPLIGGYMMILFGWVMIGNSVYKPIECPKCFKSINSRGKSKVICIACKNIVKFKNGKH